MGYFICFLNTSFSLQQKRTSYSRQNTYTKTSEGVVNLGFEEHKTEHKQPSSATAPTLSSITESTSKTTTAPTTSTTAVTTTTTAKTQKQKTETKEDSASRKT